MHTIVSTTNFGSPKSPQKLKFKYPQDTYSIIVSQQSLPPLKHQYFFPIVDVSKRFEESLEKCRKKHQKQKMKIKAIEKMTISKQLSENIIDNYRKSQNERNNTRSRCVSESVETSEVTGLRNDRRASELVDQLLLDIYGRTLGIGSSERIFETEYGSSTSFRSMNDKFDEKLQYGRLILKDVTELRILIGALKERVTYAGSLLVKQLKKRDALKSKQEKICNVVTAHLHAYSDKRSEDTNMRFSPNPVPGDSGFNQWRDAMKMVAKLPGGIPPEFRRKLWIALAEKHLQSKRVNWAQTEKLCFNEWANPDDSELGIQIVKDLHRTGCSLFCGAAGQENQALLKRVLLAYARWNKSVGYCQGFNMLAALILQVMDKNETDSVKVMIYLIEGVLPESYFANNLRGLSVDMIVFRDLLKMRLPLLSKHLEALQNDAREGNSYEPPLTNVFTMQWFLTLFCNCLPQTTVLRVWDLIFLEGNEILLRTAIAIWEKLSDRILAVNSADEFYSIMGVLTREMLEFGLVDSNTLIKSIVAIGTCSELNEMRDRYLYNITPWTQSVQSAAKKGFKLFYSDDDEVESDYDEKAAVTAAYGISIGRKRDKQQPTTREGNVIQPYAHGHPDRERLALDISALKKQYAKLRERQRQAHIILQAACARQPMGQNSTPPPIAMNHLLLGKSAIVNSRGRRLGPPKGSIPPARTKEPVKKKEPVPSGETIQWKDTAKFRRRQSCTEETDTASEVTFTPESDSSSYSEDDASSTSTELCDEPGRMSDFDSSDDKFSDILESKRTVKSMKHNLQVEKLAADCTADATEVTKSLGEFSCSEVAEMRSEFKELISEINELKVVESNELLDLKLSDATDFSDFKNSDENDVLVDITNEPVDVKDNLTFYSSSSNNLEPIIDETLVKFDDLANNEETVEQASPDNVEFSLNNDIISINEATTTETNVQNILKDEEDTFETFLQERVKILKENSSDSLTSPKEETISRRSSEEKLRRHKSYEETSSNHLEKSVIFKQQSFDIGILPIIETSLWKPYQIEEESPRDEIEDKQLPSNVKVIEETTHSKEITKQASVDLLTVEDKRLEAGRRNSERALKIIQENSLILHRILQQQKSSEKEDSEDELSRSPISKTFLRSESLLSKDEKTDEERSSKDGDEELESGVESFSVSPALLDEESDPSIKKDQFEDHDETLIISKNEDTSNEYSYKYQSSDNTSNIISSSIFEDSSVTKNEESNIIPKDLQMETSPITSTFSHDDYSPNIYEDSAKFDIASNILDYSKDNEENSSSSIQSDNKYTVEKYTSIEEISIERNTDRSIEDSLEKSPYRFSFKYKEDSEENIKISATVKKETSQDKEDKHEDLLSFLSSSPKVASSQTNNEDLMFEEKSPDDFLSYLKNTDSKWKLDSSSLSKEESKSYPQEFKEDMLSFKIPEDDYSTKQDSYGKSYEKEEISSFSYNKSVDNTSPYKYSFREDSDDNIKDKYASYLQNEDTVTSSSSKYYRSTSPIDDKFSLLYKTDTTPKQDASSIDNLDKLSSLYKDDIPSSSKFYYTPKYTLDSPEYAISNEANKTSMYSQENTNLNSASSSLVKTTEELVKPVVNDSTDNNSSEKSPDYQYNRSKLTIELVPTKYDEYSPEISPPKHLSCLQFTSFQTDIPCTSKSIQFSPICAQDKNDISPEKNSPTKTSPKYFSSFKLPTLSPPRRAVKSPLSPNKTFSPFPVQPTTRQPKELGVKLGMYKDLSPLKSPKK